MEEFKSISGYPDYEVSNLGNVRSLDRVVFHRNGNLNLKGKPIKMRIKNYGYVMLMEKGVSNNFYIHRLVALAFITNPENKSQVNHIDGNKFNNILSNLEWNTPKENLSHARINGLMNQNGSDSVKSKITEKEALEIRISNLTCKALSLIYGISTTSVHNIKSKKTWKHI